MNQVLEEIEVNVSLSSGITDWPHNAESSVLHQDFNSGFSRSMAQSMSSAFGWQYA